MRHKIIIFCYFRYFKKHSLTSRVGMSSEQFGQLRKFKLVFLGEQSGIY